jgi:hypothetical protein
LASPSAAVRLDGRRTLVLLGPFDPIAPLQITLEPPPELIAS